MQEKKPKHFVRRLVAASMTMVMAVGILTGCSQESITGALSQYMPAVQTNETISEDSKWINSTIDGSINADTPTNLKDDFYTAVNRDWLLQPLPDGADMVQGFDEIDEKFDENRNALLDMSAEDTTGLDPEVMSAEKLIHIQTLIHQLVDTAADAAARNAAGAEPLRPYIEKINSISTLDELTAFQADTTGGNPFCLQLMYFTVESPLSGDGADNYTVLFNPKTRLALNTEIQYRDIGSTGLATYKYNTELFQYELGQLGYTEEEVNDLLTACYRFEIKLARLLPTESAVQDVQYYVDNNNVYDRAGLEELAGNYPITAILDAYGVGNSETFTVPNNLQMQELGRLYTEDNLEGMKAYFIVQTVLNAVDLLDDTTATMEADFQYQISDDKQSADTSTDDGDDGTTDGTEDEPATVEQLDTDNPLAEYYTNYVLKYMPDAYQQMYIAHYCTAAEKRDIREMAEKIIAAFSDAVTESDWMSDETKAKAQDKLSAMGLHILYPDNLIDYTTLSFDDCENLVDIVAAINSFEVSQLAAKVNQPVNRSNWDLTSIQTTFVNAVYSANDNSINICAGFLATADIYSEENTYEHNLACLGTVLGHEITHGFDTTGYLYDKNGRYNSWWTDEDKYAFDKRADKLIKYYSGLSPVSRAVFMNGSNVSGEAIADLGGMKFALRVAAETPDFDYDVFFRSYAEMWRTHRTFMKETIYSSDTHPTAMLRVNVVLSQFDEFQKTYDIQPGDGMYLPADERITVW